MEIQAIRSTTATELATTAQVQGMGAAAQKPPAGATPPAPPAGGAKPAAASATVSLNSSDAAGNAAQIYSKRDLNQDGTVSYEEELLYALQNPTDQTAQTQQSQQTAAAAPNAQMQTGLSAYQQGQKTGPAASLSSTVFSA